jgi:hypothetical protein
MSFKKKMFLILAAFMIGISNVILEEERMVNDVRDTIEHVQQQDDNESFFQ